MASRRSDIDLLVMGLESGGMAGSPSPESGL